MKPIYSIMLLILLPNLGLGQHLQNGMSYNTTRVVDGHSTEMLRWRVLDVRISHKFGDIAGDAGGVVTMFGFDQAMDVRFGFEYGIRDWLNVGIGRVKGVGPTGTKAGGYLKARLLRQNQDWSSMPVTVVFLSSMAASIIESSENIYSEAYFSDGINRLSYCTQLLISSRLHERVTLQISPTLQHRNYVHFTDVNALFAVGFSGRIKASKLLALTFESFTTLTERGLVNGLQYRDHLAFGLEFDTGGHVFQLNVSNSTGIGENQFIPYTSSDWGKGQFRFGFTISRPFQL